MNKGFLGFAPQNLLGAILLLDEVLEVGKLDFTLDISPEDYIFINIYLHGKSEATAADTEGVLLSFNNDYTDANYRYIETVGDGSAASSAHADGRRIGLIASTKNAAMTGELRASIYDPRNTVLQKSAHGDSAVRRTSTTEQVRSIFHQWESLNAITRIQLTTSSDSVFAAGTRCTILGYKKVRL